MGSYLDKMSVVVIVEACRGICDSYKLWLDRPCITLFLIFLVFSNIASFLACLALMAHTKCLVLFGFSQFTRSTEAPYVNCGSLNFRYAKYVTIS